MEVSEALDDTGLSGKMRSTIWEWSQSLRSSNNKEKKGNTLKKTCKKFFFEKKMDLAVLLENRLTSVRVRGRGDFIFYFIFFALEVRGSQKK